MWWKSTYSLYFRKQTSFILQEGIEQEFLTFSLLYMNPLVFCRWSKSLPGVATNKLTPFTSWLDSPLRLLPSITYPRVCEWYFINFFAMLCVWSKINTEFMIRNNKIQNYKNLTIGYVSNYNILIFHDITIWLDNISESNNKRQPPLLPKSITVKNVNPVHLYLHKATWLKKVYCHLSWHIRLEPFHSDQVLDCLHS
jgi:hypothetical protein